MRGRRRRERMDREAAGDAEWFKDAIVYEVHVRAFQDSDGDGIGDFRGLMSRLPYLEHLGVTTLWLLPFYPSPLRDDGYDIADYLSVHPAYGTLDDVRRFLDEAHRRGMRVITELVVNHTSDQHPWFQRARAARPGSAEREFYVWTDSPDRYRGARIIFNDTERSNWSWDPVAQAYYWHRFYSHQPDLNFDNPAVVEAVEGVLDFWFDLGVDGMRLDAVPYLVEREGTHSENLRETHQVLKRLRRHVDERFPNRVFIAEANQWPEDAAAYFGDGDESHMVFHFPLMPRLFMAMRREDRLPIVDILAQTPAAPAGCQWGLFLRNHDELTLEMVTEEERQFMYHVYASDPQARLNLGIRRRLAPLVGNDRRRIELLNMLLASMPGTPILYYGDEIGMGDNIYLGDRNGVRTPMQWSPERNAGFSRASPQALYLPLIIDEQYHYRTVNVEQQAANEHSLLSWTRRVLALRRRYQAFGRGRMDLVDAVNTRVLAFTREYRHELLLVVANLSRLPQHVELDLSHLRGRVPIELFGRTAFPAIGEGPYVLTLAPHACFWFELQAPDRRAARAPLHVFQVERHWTEILAGRGRAELEAALVPYVERSMALASGARTVLALRVEDMLPVRGAGTRADQGCLSPSYALLVLQADFTSGEPQRYLLAVGADPRRDRQIGFRDIALVQNRDSGEEEVLRDAGEDRLLAEALVSLVREGGRLEGTGTALEGSRLAGAERLNGSDPPGRMRRARRGPNALIPLGGHIVLKLFRQLDAGVNPEIELGAHLNAAGFRHVPEYSGSLELRREQGHRVERLAVGVLQQYVDNAGEAWTHAVRAAGSFLSRARRSRRTAPPPAGLVPTIGGSEGDAAFDGLVGSYLDAVRLMAMRTADLLERAYYELGFELNHRPEWVRIPLEGIQALQGIEP